MRARHAVIKPRPSVAVLELRLAKVIFQYERRLIMGVQASLAALYGGRADILVKVQLTKCLASAKSIVLDLSQYRYGVQFLPCMLSDELA